MIGLIRDNPLADQLHRAFETVEDAEEQLHRLRMLEVARVVRDALPTAEAVIIEADRCVIDREDLRVHAIVDGDGNVLWNRDGVASGLDSYRTRDGCDWQQVLDHLAFDLTSAVGAGWPAMWSGSEADRDLHRADLPSRDAVAAALAELPGRVNAHLRPMGGTLPTFWLVDPVADPTMAVDGVHVTARRADDGVITLDIGTDDASAALKPTDGGAVEVDIRFNGAPLYRSARPVPDTGQQLPAPCRTDECGGDPDDGEGWDGYCGECADRREDRHEDRRGKQ